MNTIKWLLLSILMLTIFVMGGVAQAAGEKVGISLPAGDPRYAEDGAHLQRLLQGAGYNVELLFAPDAAIQGAHVQSLLGAGCKALIITPVEAEALVAPLRGAVAARIPVVSHDRLILDSSAVKYFVTMDSREIGRAQGAYLRDALNFDARDTPVFMEFFAGPQGDPNSLLQYEGAMDVLIPYINRGKVRIPSRQIAWESCAVPGSNPAEAKRRMAALVAAKNYSPDGMPLSAVLSPNDSVSSGVIEALLEAGFTARNFPLITGEGGRSAEHNLQAGLQAMTVYRDPKAMAEASARLVDAALRGLPAPVTPGRMANNATGDIPTVAVTPVIVTRDSYSKILARVVLDMDIGGNES